MTRTTTSIAHLQLLPIFDVDHGECRGSLSAHLKDTVDLYQGIANGQLPAVSFVKPSGWTDGHPASSKLDLFEGFVKKIVDFGAEPAHPLEGHGDPRYVRRGRRLLRFRGTFRPWTSSGTEPASQPWSFRRAPGGRAPPRFRRVSILKFIERHWGLHPVLKAKPRQPAEPRSGWTQPVRSDELARYRRPVRPLRLRPAELIRRAENRPRPTLVEADAPLMGGAHCRLPSSPDPVSWLD